MAITRHELQITWDTGNNSDSCPANSQVESDVHELDPTCIAAQIHCKADNSTTPATDDRIDWYLVQTGGDPDGTGADEYDTDEHALFLGSTDTNVDEPAQFTVPLPIPQAHFKVQARGNHSDTTTNAITVSATVTEQRAA